MPAWVLLCTLKKKTIILFQLRGEWKGLFFFKYLLHSCIIFQIRFSVRWISRVIITERKYHHHYQPPTLYEPSEAISWILIYAEAEETETSSYPCDNSIFSSPPSKPGASLGVLDYGCNFFLYFFLHLSRLEGAKPNILDLWFSSWILDAISPMLMTPLEILPTPLHLIPPSHKSTVVALRKIERD